MNEIDIGLVQWEKAVVAIRDTHQAKDREQLMDGGIERSAAYQASHIHLNLRKLFNWCMERGIVDVSPAMGIKPPTREQARDRALTDDEIRAVLRVCANDAWARCSRNRNRDLCQVLNLGVR